MSQMMKCGHAANAIIGDGQPVCAICLGIHSGADVVDEEPDLTGRRAECIYCGMTAQSSTNLAFFEYLPTAPMDRFYSGCRGWD